MSGSQQWVRHWPDGPATTAEDRRLDAVWLCKVAERQMLRPSFVPPPQIRQLRYLTRYRYRLRQGSGFAAVDSASTTGCRTWEVGRLGKLAPWSYPGPTLPAPTDRRFGMPFGPCPHPRLEARPPGVVIRRGTRVRRTGDHDVELPSARRPARFERRRGSPPSVDDHPHDAGHVELRGQRPRRHPLEVPGPGRVHLRDPLCEELRRHALGRPGRLPAAGPRR